jgi:hypothetical protein
MVNPDDVAREALDHLADGPTWIFGSNDPTAASPLGAMRRRDAVLAMSRSSSVKTATTNRRAVARRPNDPTTGL